VRASAVIIIPLLAVAGTAWGQSAGGYGDYSGWQGWSRIRLGVSAGLACSYDRSGANSDYNHYEQPSGFLTTAQTVTAATIQGPGIIYRYWMPHANAKQAFPVRMYFDGEAGPRLDTTSTALLGGSFGYFAAPLVTTSAGGQVCYETIPFQTSLRIETENRDYLGYLTRHYYQYSYLRFPPGTDIASWNGQLSPEAQIARSAAASLFSNAGQHPAGTDPDAIRLEIPASEIAAGGTLTLADLVGPALVRQLNINMAPDDAARDGLHLRVYCDGGEQALIDVPVGDFFGAGHNRAVFRSIPVGTDSSDGFYCYWPMPLRLSMHIALHNSTAAVININSAAVVYKPGPIPADSGYLQARCTSTIYSGQPYHLILAAAGCGQYVGNLLYIQQPNSALRILEGDEVITVDGGAPMNGTGLEDAYNGGYYYNWTGVQNDEPEGPKPQAVIRPLHGVLYVTQDTVNSLVRADQYRWYIADRVPFTRSIEVKIESSFAVTGATFRSVAFWYQMPPVPGNFDHDTDVDAADVQTLSDCAAGAGVEVDPSGPCAAADLDHDSDVDGDDFGMLQRCYSGAEVLASPGCEDW